MTVRRASQQKVNLARSWRNSSLGGKCQLIDKLVAYYPRANKFFLPFKLIGSYLEQWGNRAEMKFSRNKCEAQTWFKSTHYMNTGYRI